MERTVSIDAAPAPPPQQKVKATGPSAFASWASKPSPVSVPKTGAGIPESDNEGLKLRVNKKAHGPGEEGDDDDEEPTAEPSKLGAKSSEDKTRRSARSAMSNASSMGASSTVREITETWTVIAQKMKWSILALILNGALIIFLNAIRIGLVVDIDAVLIGNYGGVMLELVLLICNIVSIWSLEEAASCVFGYLLSQKKGFSLAVCGYLQTPSFGKLGFSQTLSLTSPSRKILTRISFIWIAIEVLKLFTPFSAIALNSQQYATFNDMSDCAYFVQDPKTGPVDREWPTLDTESGVGEYVFGSSLGTMRSEVGGVNVTTAMHPPTLISSLNNGDIIEGLGFTVDISTTCSCSTGVSSQAFASAGVDPSQSNATVQNFLSLNQKMGLTFGVVHDNVSVTLSNVFSGANLCGGNGVSIFLPLICSTVMSNHNAAHLEIQFMTDGTSASISPNTVTFLSSTGTADIPTWLSFAMNAITNGPTSYYLTPPTVPGSLAPLLWWTSPNLIAIDRAAVEAGMETMYAILFKAGIQRTYTPRATSCIRKNTLISHQSTILMTDQGYYITLVMLGIQMSVAIGSIAAFILWFMSPNPIGPAIRATQESIFLMTLLTSSPHLGIGINELCNAETYAIWQRLDVVCRIGESVDTLDDEVGKIIVDKPSLVRAIQNGKKYF
ncbi:hypothetical protein HDU98_005003 [Podochytrium sp. JEL0797]|nr:hypothetical protein HDU98_005003 [Podochytrium sp. JEL0797]